MTWFLVDTALAVLLVILAAGPFLTYARWTAPSLARIPARFAAYLIAALPSAVALFALVAFATGILNFLAPYSGRVLVLVLGFASLWEPIVRLAVWLTGGPAARSVEDALLRAQADSAAASLGQGDLELARRDLETLAADPAARTQRLGMVAGQLARQLGLAPPSLRELGRMRRGLARAIDAHWAPPAAVRAGALLGIAISVAAAAVPIIVPSYVANRACIDAELHLPGAASSSPSAQLPIYEAIAESPEIGSIAWADTPLDLDAAAESRHDPDTRDQLLDSGFVSGYQRIVRAADDRAIQIDAFEFESHEGARRYQETVIRYACRFANLGFGHPDGGVGLQVRYSTGDPIVEQVSWVEGSRRYVVSLSLLSPPAEHDRVIAITSRYR